MPNYRRNRVEGGTYFFTLALADRRSDLLVQEVTALRASVARVRELYPFSIDAGSCYPSTCTRSGLCRTATPTFQRDGLSSNAAFRQELQQVKTDPPRELSKASAASGSAGSGNTQCVTRLILRDTSIMSTSTRSSMVLSIMPRTDRSHHFDVPWPAGITHPIGEVDKTSLANTVKDLKDKTAESGGVLRLRRRVGCSCAPHHQTPEQRRNAALGKYQITSNRVECGKYAGEYSKRPEADESGGVLKAPHPTLAVFLASDKSSYVAGAELFVDGGLSAV